LEASGSLHDGVLIVVFEKEFIMDQSSFYLINANIFVAATLIAPREGWGSTVTMSLAVAHFILGLLSAQ